VYAGYFVSGLIWFLTPRGLVLTLRQLVGQLLATFRSITRGVPHDDSLTFALPFAGYWKVHNGGVDRRTSHAWSMIGQRYAYDFVLASPESGLTYEGSPDIPRDYLAFGKPVLAAADGVVVAVRDDIRDYRRAGTGWIDLWSPDLRGNHVVIQHAPCSYTLYAHLMWKSALVRPGDQVAAGQAIASCGHSGHSTEPHLHFQLQDRADFFTAVSLPVAFRDFRRGDRPGGEAVSRGHVQRGQWVGHAGRCDSGVVETATFVRATTGDLLNNILTLVLAVLGLYTMAGWLLALLIRRV
jgi:hypothetical protein